MFYCKAKIRIINEIHNFSTQFILQIYKIIAVFFGFLRINSELCMMDDFSGFSHFLLKVNERLTLMHGHYVPNGKQLPETDRDLLLELFKIWDDGCLESISKEPLIQAEVTQAAMFTGPATDNMALKAPEKTNGTEIDKDKAKKK